MKGHTRRKTSLDDVLRGGRFECEVLGAWTGKVTIQATGLGVRSFPATQDVLDKVKEVGPVRALLTVRPAEAGVIITDLE